MEQALIDDRYLLLAELGSGGEARVFRGRDTTNAEEVAVRLSLHSAPLSKLEQPPDFHSGWARILGEGSDSHYGAYQVFELLEGETLGHLVGSGPLQAEDWRLFVEQSLDAVEALHRAGWTHGDLNADNFLQTTAGWKLLELPFLRFEPPIDRTLLFGSIHTLAPEQINGAPADVRSDLYALGCLYYYAASGHYPHPGTTNQEVAIHCLRFPAAPLRETANNLPCAWSDWVMKLIALDPKDRCSSVSAAHQLLRDAVA